MSSIKYPVTTKWVNLNDFNIVPDVNKLKKNRFALEFNYLIISFLLKQNPDSQVNREISYYSLPMKTPSLVSINSDEILNTMIPVFFSISYISILFKFVLWLVVEKEKKLKDLLTRQGISTYQYFLSWLATFVIMTIIPILVNSILLNIYYFPNTNFIFIFMNLFLFSLNIIGMALVFHQFVDNIRSGQSLLKVVFIGVSIFSVVINRDEVSIVYKYLFSIFPQTVLKCSFEIFMQTKNYEKGLDTNMLFAYFKGMNMFILYSLYIIDFVLYFSFAFFLQRFSQSGMGFGQFLISNIRKENKKVKVEGIKDRDGKCKKI
jgi:hypothetical protein